MADVLVGFNKQVVYTGGGSESDECSSSFDECSTPYPRCALQQSPVLSTSTFFSTMATGLEKAGSDRSDQYDQQLEGDCDSTTRASSRRTSASPEDADWYRTRTPSPDFCHRFHGHSPDHAHAALSGLLRCTQSEASAPPSPHNMDVPYGCSPKGGVVMNPFAMPASSTMPQHPVASDWGISCSNALFQDRLQHRVLDPCRQMDQHPSVHYQAPTKHLEPEHQSPPQRSHSSQQRQPHAPMLVQLTHVDSGEQSCWQLSEQSWRQLQAQFPQALGLPAMPAAGSPQMQQVLVRLPSQVDQYQRPSQEQQGQHQRQHTMPLVVVHPRRQQGQSQQPWQQWQQPGRDEQSKQRFQAGQQQGQPPGQRHQMQHPGQQQSQQQPQVLDPPALPQQRRKGSHQPSTQASQGRLPRRAQMPAEAGLQEVQQQQQQDKVVLDDGIEAVPPPPQPVTQAASIGSLGHPDLCSAPCKFFASRAGCKDSANCDRCHLCSWKKSVHGKKRKPCSSDANRAAVGGKG